MKRWLFIVLSAFWCAGWSLEVQKIDPTCEAGSCFEDTVRVVLIWNSLTGSAGGCNVSEGAIGEYQKDFVLRSLNSAGIQPCAVLSQPEINAGATVASLTSTCGGKPHTIYYLDNGYEWAPSWNPSAPKPDALLLAAAQDSIGLVAVGDDAVVAGSNIFSYMSCPLGTWDACQYVAYGHNDNLGLMDATQDFDGPNDKVYMALDIMEDVFLPDGGLLRGITADTLHFKPHPNATGGSTFDPDLHRCMADADVWEIDRTLLDNYSFIGLQKAYSEKGRWSGGEQVHNFGNDLDYRTISALQEDMRRIVILGYQPQFLVDTNASAQLLYNAMFFTSKAKEVPTNMPNPWFVADKQCSDFDTETFIPCQGASWSFAETPKIKLASAFRGAPIYYTVDGSNPQDVCAGFDPQLSPPDGSTACRMFLPETDDGFPITGNTTVLAYTPSGGSWNRLSSEVVGVEVKVRNPNFVYFFSMLPQGLVEIGPKYEKKYYDNTDAQMYVQMLLPSIQQADTARNVTISSVKRGDSRTMNIGKDTDMAFGFSLPLDIVNPVNSQDSLLQVYPWDSIAVHWTDPSDPEINVTKYIEVRHPPTLRFEPSDSVLASKVKLRLVDFSPFEGDSKTVRLYFAGDSVQNEVQLLPVPGEQGVWAYSANMKDLYDETVEQNIIASYSSIHYSSGVVDTAVFFYYNFGFPETGSIHDLDGDGVADKVVLNMSKPLDAADRLDSITLWWNDTTQSRAITSWSPNALDPLQYELNLASVQPFDAVPTRGAFDGLGRVVFNGALNNGLFTDVLEVDIQDSIGPILVNANVQVYSEGVKKLNIRVSEPVRLRQDTTGAQHALEKLPGPMIVQIFSAPSGRDTLWSVLQLDTAQSYARPGDSIHFYAAGGNHLFVDVYGNAPHSNNPYIKIETNETADKFIIGMVENVSKPNGLEPVRQEYAPGGALDPAQNNPKKPYAVHLINHDRSRQETVHISGASQDAANRLPFTDYPTTQGPAMLMDIPLPLVQYGEGGDWRAVIHFSVLFYDNLGQYLYKMADSVVIDNNQYLNEEGYVTFMLEWLPDSEKGIYDENGRAVGNGALIAGYTFRTIVNAVQATTRTEQVGDKLFEVKVQAGEKYPGFPRKNAGNLWFGYLRP